MFFRLRYVWQVVIILSLIVTGAGASLSSTAYALDIQPGDLLKLPDIPLLDPSIPITLDYTKHLTLLPGWAAEIDEGLMGSVMTGDDGTVYVVAEAENVVIPAETKTILYAYAPSGELIWKFRASGALISKPMIGPDQHIYVGTQPNTLLKIAPNGQLDQTFELNYKPQKFIGIGLDGGIYYINTIGHKQGLLVGFNPDTEAYTTYENIYEHVAALGRDGTLYYVTFDQTRVIALRNGVKLWEYGTELSEIVHILPGWNGEVYITDNISKPDRRYMYLYRLNASSGNSMGQVLMTRLSSTFSYATDQNGYFYYAAYDKDKKQYLLEVLDQHLKLRTAYTLTPNLLFDSYVGPSGTLYMLTEEVKPILLAMKNQTTEWSTQLTQKYGKLNPTEGPEGNFYIFENAKMLRAIVKRDVSKLTLDKSDLTLGVGKSDRLTVHADLYDPPFPYVRWSSSNPTVATVSEDGLVTSVSAGQAKITATTFNTNASVSADVKVVASATEVPKAPEVPEEPSMFSDIKGNPYESYIKKASELGITEGYPDGTFRPKGRITRAEFATLLVKALQPEVMGTELSFKDKNQIPAWAASFIAMAVQSKLIFGYDDNTYRPSGLITRAEMISMVARGTGLPLNGIPEPTGFKDDASIPDWANSAVSTAVKNELLIPDELGALFQPKALATRDESLTAIVRLLEWREKWK